ncbi:MAG: PilZ domain-containing protein [Rhodospirillales bacterium]|nr:PilZ domain-containing protein [Alphaproteobacteria bacterium]MBL6947305.1 PilZ domain-containing protein [Rhodospirillales bacterium]
MVDGGSDNQDEDIRRYPRTLIPGNLPATVKDEGGREQAVEITDISAGGAGLVVDGTFANNAFIELHMDKFGDLQGRVVRKFLDGVGVEFSTSESEREAMDEELRAFRKTVAQKKF